ncbi:MAG: CDP-glycerol glycerophosphotransferase family protein, partial [Eubacteriaceae bacterium]
MNKLELLLVRIVLNIMYLLFCIFPVNKKKIVFASPRNDTIQGNIKYIYDEILNQGLDYKCVLLYDKYGYSFIAKVKYFFLLVLRTYHFATARYLILDNAYLPVHIIKHRKKTKVIQTWHACGAFKKFGLSTIYLKDGIKGNEVKFLHKNYDIAITSSKNHILHYAQAFGMNKEEILPIGVPRTDFFFNKEKLEKERNEIYADFPQFKDKKIILYAPTFRGRGRDKYIGFPLDIDKLKKELYPEYFLIIKSHPHVEIKDSILYDKEFMILIWNKYSLNSLFTVADMLITDYSSGIYEFALLNKPMIF